MISNKKIFYVNSRDRISGTDSDFLYKLNILPSDDFDYAVVLECLIPKSYWLISPNRNTFELEENGTTVTISVPVGNYNRRSFANEIQILLNASSPNGWVYQVSYPNSMTEADTGFYTYSVSGNSSIQPSFIFNTYLYEQMGFNRNTTNTFVSNSLTSTNVIKLQLEDTIFIHSDMIYNNGMDNVLQHVFASAGSGNYSNIHFTTNGDVEAYAKKLSKQNNNIYRFYLCDEDQNPINLNGLNMSIVLMLFKKNTILEDGMKYLVYQLKQNFLNTEKTQ